MVSSSQSIVRIEFCTQHPLRPPKPCLPAGLSAADWDTRSSHQGLVGVARLAPGVPFESARSELVGIAAQIASENPDTNENESVLVRPAIDALVGDMRPTLVALLGAVGFVLLIACANVANLMLVRSSARAQEVSLRTALGAGKARLALEGLAESLVLAGAGGVLGLLLARMLLSASVVLLDDVPRAANASIDARVVLFTAALAIVTAVLFGVVPAVARTRAGGGGVARATGQRVSARIRGGFVVAQIGLALMLLIGAGVLVKSFVAMMRADGGLDPAGVATFAVRLPDARYGEEASALFYDNLLSDFASLRDVVSAGAISTLPFSGSGAQSGIAPMGGTRKDEVRTDVNVVTADYFGTMGVTLVSGRVFDVRDRAGAPPVVIVDERFASRMWPGLNAVGQRVQGWGLDGATVVGVVRHVKNYGVAAESRQEMYMPHAQRPFFRMYVVVRMRDDLARVLPSLREIVRRADPDLPVDNVALMSEIVGRTVSTPRMAAFVGAGFAFIATLLAAVGLYGVVAYGVSLRVREIGTRVALGARAGQVLRLVVGQALAVAGVGVLAGLAGAWAVTRLLEGLLFGVAPRDPAAFVGLPLVLLAVAAIAGLLPARRAARISPLEALRGD
jgi:predicted permease